MNLELTIQSMFDDYPNIFKTRADCLNHLFCTIGNGYEWIDGELVDKNDENRNISKLKEHLEAGKAKQLNKVDLYHAAVCGLQQYKERRGLSDKSYQQVLKNIENKKGKYYEYPRKFRWYFYHSVSEHAYLFNYPKNIKPDFLEGIEECKKYLLEDGYDKNFKLNDIAEQEDKVQYKLKFKGLYEE